MGRKKTSRIRAMRAAARKQLPRLLNRQLHRCHYCSEPIIEVATVPLNRRLSSRSGILRWLDHQGQARERRIATVEHIIPLADNGLNNDWNLVAACEGCNNLRNHERQMEKNGAQRRRWKLLRELQRHAGASNGSSSNGNRRRFFPQATLDEINTLKLDLADVTRSIELMQGQLADLAASDSSLVSEMQGRLRRLRRKQRSLKDRLERLMGGQSTP